jgi:PA14 domain/Bacterial pre-peptidase C-terminal domain
MSDFDPHDFNNLLKTSVNTGIIAPTQGIIPQLEANRTLTGVGGQEVKAQSLTPDTSDNIILGDASQTKMTNGTITDTNTSLPDSAVDLITGQAISEVYKDQTAFPTEPNVTTQRSAMSVLGSISLNQTQSGQLSTTDSINPTRSGCFYDDYRLNGVSAGQQVQINMSSTAFDSYLQVINESTGQVVAYDDDSGGNRNSRLTFTPQAGVSYRLRATSYSNYTGNYTLSVSGTDGNDTLNTAQGFNMWMGVDTPVESTNRVDSIGGGDLNDYYRFYLNNTRQVNVTLNGLQADANLQLLDQYGNEIQSSTNGSASAESITRTLNAGYYFIRVYPNGNASTNYQVNLTLTTLQTQVPANNWKAEYFNNTNLTGTPVFVENLGDGSQGFSRNWGNNSPTNTPSDNFSARMTTQRYLAPGLYQIKAQADDGVRVKIGNQSVIERWLDQSFATNSGYFRSNGGTFPITVDYYERGGSAAINFSITPATKFQDPVDYTQQWKSTVYSWNSSQGSAPPTNFWEGDITSPNAIGEINLGSNTRSDGKKGINVNWGQGAPNGDGNRLPHDFFAMRAYTQADFDGSPYKFRVQGDDGFQLLAINQSTGQQYDITPANKSNQWTQAYSATEFTSQLPAGRYYMHFHQYEGGGDARFDLSWEKMGNPKLDIQLSYPNRDFTQSEINQIEKAAQNWERIITKDKDSSGVLKISVVKAPTDVAYYVAQTNQESAYNSRTNFGGPAVDINGVDYHNNIRFNPNHFSRMVNNNLLVRLAMHEIGHALGLDHEDGVSLMSHNNFDATMTNSMYNTMTAEGYGIDRNVTINWY